MKIPFFSLSRKQNDYYLGLFLKEEEGVVMIIDLVGGTMHIREKEKFSYSNGWENLTDDIDEILYRLEKKIEQQLSKTIFFVYSHLVDEKAGDIKKPYLVKIKELVKNLELEALGYIECYEAVSSFLQKKEEVPLTAILLELDKTDLGLFVYKGGKISHQAVVPRTSNIVDDFTKGLEDVKGKLLLPSRIILYNSHDLDKTSEMIVNHRFDKDFFIQLPRVDILKEEMVLSGLVGVFADQMGKGNKKILLPTKENNEEVMGFLINQDIAKEKDQQEELETEPKAKKLLPTEKIKLPNFFSFFKPKRINSSLAAIVGLFIIVSALILNEYFFHQSDLKLYLPSEKIEKTMNLSITYKNATDSSKLTAEGSTSGEKEIGNPAKGKVMIHNFADQEKKLEKGTIFQGGGIKFLLDSDVKIASSSLAPDGSVKLPGKKDGSLTASAIGSEGNIDKGKRFVIADLPEGTYFGINEEAFSGGSKKNIRTVSINDREELRKKILAKSKKEEKISKPNMGDVVSSLTKTVLKDEIFSAEVGEETNKLTLTATADTEYYYYSKDELVKKILSNLKENIRSGYIIERSMLVYNLDKVKISGDSLSMNATVKAKAIKKTAEEEVLRAVRGKNRAKLDQILREKFAISGYDLKIKEPLPILKNFMPFFYNNINLTFSSL